MSKTRKQYESDRLALEHKKLEAEIDRISAEAEKLRAEALKFRRERAFYPIAITGSLSGTVAALITHFFK